MTGPGIHSCKCPTDMPCGLALSTQPPPAAVPPLWSQKLWAEPQIHFFQPPGRGRVTGNLRTQTEGRTGASCTISFPWVCAVGEALQQPLPILGSHSLWWCLEEYSRGRAYCAAIGSYTIFQVEPAVP